MVTIGFDAGVPVRLNGNPMEPIPLVRELNRVGGEHGIGRSDVIEDRLMGIKSREVYEAPAATLLVAAHRDLEMLVHSKEMYQIRETLTRRYAELIYQGLWFHDARRALQAFFRQTQHVVTGDVRIKLGRGSFSIMGRQSPHGLYDCKLANQSNLDLFDNQWVHGFASMWALQSRMAAQQKPPEPKPATDNCRSIRDR